MRVSRLFEDTDLQWPGADLRRARQADWKGIGTCDQALPNLLRPNEHSSYVSRNVKFSMSESRPTRAAARRSDAGAGRTEKAVGGIQARELVYMNTKPHHRKVDNTDFRNGGDYNSRRASDDAAITKGPVLRGLPLVLLCCVVGTIRRLRDSGMTGSLVKRTAFGRVIMRTRCRYGMADADARHQKCDSNKGTQEAPDIAAHSERRVYHRAYLAYGIINGNDLTPGFQETGVRHSTAVVPPRSLTGSRPERERSYRENIGRLEPLSRARPSEAASRSPSPSSSRSRSGR